MMKEYIIPHGKHLNVYKGDKVFGLYPSTYISMYRPEDILHDFNTSKESDHELVYATFSDNPSSNPVSGGKRKNTKHKKYMKTNKINKNIKNKKKSQKK